MTDQAAIRRRKTKAAVGKKSNPSQQGGIEYDVTQASDTQQRQTGRRSVGTVSRRSRSATGGAGSVERGTLGPSGLPMLRTSERGTFKRCRFLYDLEYIQLRKPNTDTPPLMFGSMVHIALAGFYKKGIKRGPHPAGLFVSAVHAEAARVSALTGTKPHLLIDEWRDRIELGEAMLNNYIDHYGNDDRYQVLGTELPFRVVVHHPKVAGGGVQPWFWYTGIVDLFLYDRETKRKLIRDHKTTAAITTKYLALDDQTTSYWTFGVQALREKGLLKPSEQIDGLEFNFLRKQKPDERPWKMEADGRGVMRKYHLNLDGSISKKQPAPYFHRETIWRQQFESDHQRRRVLNEFDDMQRVRNSAELRYKNPTKWTCPGCWAFDICELHEIGADWESVRDQTTHKWDPYEAHEVYAGETR